MKHILIGLLLIVPVCLSAQQTAQLSIFGGAVTYLGDLETEDILPSLDIANLSIGVNASVPLKPSILVRAGLSYQSLEGYDARSSDHDLLDRNFSFTNKIAEASIQLLWEPFASKRYPITGGYKNIISPYVFLGAGIIISDPITNYNESHESIFKERIEIDKAAKKSPALVLPFGGGLRVDLSKQLSLGLEMGLRKTNTDYLDGISVTGKVNTDWYVSGGLTLAYRWSKPDYDRDGFMDENDLCPFGAGPDYTQGCPDSDGDLIPDNLDKCPYQIGKAYAQGCPDSDYDGIADFLDKCPNIPGHASGQGCLDQDGDGIKDDDDMCPNCFATNGLSGCPDSDGDGVEDSRDRCPNMKGTLASGGCPFMDQDLDGVPDKDDACPNSKGLKEFDGCPDSDADGLMDSQDKCPLIVGTLANGGCPELTEDIKSKLGLLTETVQFETGGNQLTSSSKESLIELVDILNTYPFYHLTIAGHTDSRGKESSNLSLSQKRAEACYSFLNENSISTTRMNHKGFGETKPIANNDTAEGRTKNRRVTFELFVK